MRPLPRWDIAAAVHAIESAVGGGNQEPYTYTRGAGPDNQLPAILRSHLVRLHNWKAV